MADYITGVAELKAEEGFSAMSADDQYKAQKDVLLQTLYENEKFRAGSVEFQRRYVNETMSETFKPTYENPASEEWVNTLSADYLKGDPAARKVLATFYTETDVNDRLPIIASLFSRIAEPEGVYKALGLHTKYSDSAMVINRTRGADDNKARTQIETLFRASNDEEMIEMLDSKVRDRTVMALRVGEEVAVALLAVLTGGLVGGAVKSASVGAKVASTGGRVGGWLAMNAPALATEASIEGIRGMADNISQLTRKGEDPTVKGALTAFGVHAGIDMAIGLTVGKLASGISALRHGYDKSIADELVRSYGDGVARGVTPTQRIKLPAGLDEDQFRTLASANLTHDTMEKLGKGVSVDDLNGLERVNLRAYDQGFSLTQLPDGKSLVQPKAAPDKAVIFKNIDEAEEWIGNRGSKYLDRLAKEAEVDAMASYLSRNPQINYSLGRKVIDDAWTVKAPAKKFAQPNARQYINPSEMKAFVDSHNGQYVRFVMPVDEKALKGNKNLFPTGRENLRVVENQNGNSIAFIGDEYKLADQADLDIASGVADRRLKDTTMGDITREEIIRSELVKQGYTGARHTDGTVSIYFPDKVKVSNRYVNPKTGATGKIVGAENATAPLKAKIKVDVGSDAVEIAANPKRFADLGVRVLSGDLNVNQVRRYANAYLQSKGVDVKIRINRNTSGMTKVTKKANGDISVSIPATILDPKLQRETYSKLLKGLDEAGGIKGKGAKTSSYTKQFTSQQKNYTRAFYSIENFDAYAKSLEGVESVVGLRKVKAGYEFLSIKTKKTYISNDADSLMRDIGVNEMDEVAFEAALKQDGYSVIRGTDGFSITAPGTKNVIASGTDQVEIAKSLDFYPERLPSSMAPDIAIVSEVPGLNLVATKQFSSGSASEQAAFMGNFEDYRKVLNAEVKLKSKAGNSLLKIGKTNYEVTIPQLNYVRRFDNARDARKFMDTEWKTLESAREAARDKGLRMYYENGEFKIRNDSVNLSGKTVDDIRARIAEAPTPTYAKEVVPKDVRDALEELGIELELPPGFTRLSLSSNDMYPNPKDWSVLKDTSPGVFDKYGPRVAAIRRLGLAVDKRLGNKLGLGKMFERLHKNSRIALSKSYSDAQELFGLFKENKLIIPVDRRKGITYYLEAQATNPKLLDDIIKTNGLTSHDLDTVIPALTDFYTRKADELGIPFHKILQDYQPRMRKLANEFKEAMDNHLLTKEFMSANSVTKQFINRKGFEFYNAFERFGDVRKAWMEEDALSVALRYTNAGNRKFYAGRAWNDMYDVLKVNRDDIAGDGYITLLNSYKDALTHPQNAFHHSSVTKSLHRTMARIGFGEEAGIAFIDTLVSLPYMTSMAFRPWMPFRNMFQIFTILPLRTGNLHTSVKAASNFVKNPKAILTEMIDEGVIAKRGGTQSKEYLDMMRGNTLVTKGPARRFYQAAMELGLKPYGLSDDFTRGVAYMASKDMFEKGMRKATVQGKFNLEKFKRVSRLDGLPPAVQEQVTDFISAGNMRGAETTMARANIDATMFDYGAMNKPMGASGTMGHLFYQFGTYSLNYVQSVGTNFRYGSTANKVAGMVAMASGMGLVAGGMKAAGVDNSSFLGYNMAQFNGGPFFQLAMDGLGSMSPGISGELARKDLLKAAGIKYNKEGLSVVFPSLAPGYMQIKYGKKFLEDWKEGDYWGAWLDMMTIPQHKSRNE